MPDRQCWQDNGQVCYYDDDDNLTVIADGDEFATQTAAFIRSPVMAYNDVPLFVPAYAMSAMDDVRAKMGFIAWVPAANWNILSTTHFITYLPGQGLIGNQVRSEWVRGGADQVDLNMYPLVRPRTYTQQNGLDTMQLLNPVSNIMPAAPTDWTRFGFRNALANNLDFCMSPLVYDATARLVAPLEPLPKGYHYIGVTKLANSNCYCIVASKKYEHQDGIDLLACLAIGQWKESTMVGNKVSLHLNICRRFPAVLPGWFLDTLHASYPALGALVRPAAGSVPKKTVGVKQLPQVARPQPRAHHSTGNQLPRVARTPAALKKKVQPWVPAKIDRPAPMVPAYPIAPFNYDMALVPRVSYYNCCGYSGNATIYCYGCGRFEDVHALRAMGNVKFS